MSDLAERLVRVLAEHRATGGYVWTPTTECRCGEMVAALDHRAHLADALAAEVGRALEGVVESMFDPLHKQLIEHADHHQAISEEAPTFEGYAPGNERALAYSSAARITQKHAANALDAAKDTLGLTTTPASLAGRDEETK